MNTPWHLLHHSATLMPASISEVAGIDKPEYALGSTYPCRVEESSSQRGLDNQRLENTWTGIGFFPPEYNGSAVTIAKDTLISVTGPGFASATVFRVSGPARNPAGHGVLQVLGLERHS